MSSSFSLNKCFQIGFEVCYGVDAEWSLCMLIPDSKPAMSPSLRQHTADSAHTHIIIIKYIEILSQFFFFSGVNKSAINTHGLLNERPCTSQAAFGPSVITDYNQCNLTQTHTRTHTHTHTHTHNKGDEKKECI